MGHQIEARQILRQELDWFLVLGGIVKEIFPMDDNGPSYNPAAKLVLSSHV